MDTEVIGLTKCDVPVFQVSCERGILKSDTGLLGWPAVMGPTKVSSFLTRGHHVGNEAGELSPVHRDCHPRIPRAVKSRGLAVS